jgi:putative transcriptional regulator
VPFHPTHAAACSTATSNPAPTSPRRFLGLTQAPLAAAMGLRVATIRSYEQGRRRPRGLTLALLRLYARHPRILLARVPATRNPSA